MIKKTLRYLTLSLAFAGMSANAYADYNGQCNNDDACCDDSKFDLSAHVLIAKPCQSTNWIETRIVAPTPDTTSYRTLEYDWDWGVAVAGSFKFCDDWSLGARYSYVQGDGNDSYNASAGLALGDVLSLGHGSFTAAIVVADETGAVDHGIWAAKQETEMHTFDLIAQYECCLCGNFKFRPFGGVRFMKIENDYYAKTTTAGTVYTTAGDGVFSAYENTAYGVVGGFDWEFSLCGDFYLIGGVSGAALSADSENTWKYLVQNASTTAAQVKNDPDCEALFAFEANVGVAWNTCLFGKGFDVQVLYEGRHLSNIASFDATTNPNASQQYGVHGFKVGVGLSF